MNQNNLLQRILIGVKKKPLGLIINIFVIYAAIWTLLEPLIGFVPEAQKHFSGDFKFLTLVLISSCVGIYRNAVPGEITIKHDNCVIKVVFGDLFSFDGFKAIPVSRYFFETQVVQTSLQNKIIQLFLGSKEGNEGFRIYKQALSNALQGESYQELYRDATKQKEKYYPLGTTALLELNGQDFILFTLTETELKGHIPDDNCNIAKMWAALEDLWKKARVHSRGNSINIPLIGSGVTGIRLEPTRLLEFNLLAIVNSIEEGGKITTEEVRIVLHPKYIEDIDLNNFQRMWGQR
jgi:hypothetical protein